VCLIGVYLTGVYVMGTHLISMHLIGVYIMGVHYNKQSFLLSRVRICGFWPDAAFLILALSGNLALRSLFRAVMG
jgi:hypothetical protein